MDEMDEDKKKKKGTISEDDMSLLLPKYSAATIIAVLQEISQSTDVDTDWDTLVKNTSTRIANPREYQMLWRHLAYGHSLAEGLDENSEVLDDDSDLEYELEPFPTASDEALNEAAACVKRWAIIRKRRQTNSNPSGVTNVTGSQLSEAQLAARHALNAALDMPMIDSLSATCSVGVTPTCNLSTSSAIPAARNEAPPISGAPMESSTKPTAGSSFQQAVHQNQAPNQPTTILQKGTSGSTPQASHQNQQAPQQQTTPSFQKGTSGTASQASHLNQQAPQQTTTSFQKGTLGTSSQALHQNQQAPQTTTSFQKGASGTPAKSRITTKKATPIPVKASVGPNPMIQAAAVAAGARIITPTAASLLKVAQSKNAVHIRPGGGSLIKPSLPGSTKPLPPNPGTRPNVHYIRTGLTSASQPPATFSTVVPSIPQSGCSQQAHGNSVGPAAVTCQVPSAVTASSSLSVAASFGASEVKSKDAIVTVGSGILCVDGVIKSVEEMKVDESTLSTQEVVKPVQKMKVDSSADVVKCSGQDDQADLPNLDMVIKKEVTMENLRNTSQEMEVDEEQLPVIGKLTEKQPAVIEDLQDGTTMQKASSPCQAEATMMEASSPCQDIIVNEKQNHCS